MFGSIGPEDCNRAGPEYFFEFELNTEIKDAF